MRFPIIPVPIPYEQKKKRPLLLWPGFQHQAESSPFSNQGIVNPNLVPLFPCCSYLRLPVAERIFQRFFDAANLHAGGQKFGDIHHAIGTRGLGGLFVELGIVGPELEVVLRLQIFLDQCNNMSGGDETWVGDVVGAKRSAHFPEVNAGFDEIGAMRNGVHVVVHLGITLQFAEVIAFVVEFVKGDAQAPDVTVADAGDDFFAEGFGAAVKTARRRAKGKIGRVGLFEAVDAVGMFFHNGMDVWAREVRFDLQATIHLHLCADVDAAGGNVAPRDPGDGTSLGDGLGQQGIAGESISAREFGGVHVRLTGVAGGVDDERRLFGLEIIQQHVEARVIGFLAGERDEIQLAPFEFAGKRFADVTGGAEQ